MSFNYVPCILSLTIVTGVGSSNLLNPRLKPAVSPLPKSAVLKLIARLDVPTGPKSVVLMPDGKHVWANCLYAHKCVMIEVATRKIAREFRTPGEPVESCFTQNGKLAWVSQYNRQSVVVLDTANGKPLHTIKVGKVPKIVAASPDDRWVYVANFESADVTVIDARQMKAVKTIPVRRHPRGICFSPDGKFAYVACMGGQALARFNVASDHKLEGYVPAGTTPRHTVITKDGSYVYVSNNMTARASKIDLKAEKVVASCKVGRQARTVALAPDETLLFVCNNEDDSVSVVSTDTMTETLRMKTGKHPIGCTIAADGTQFWVSSYPWNKLYVYEISGGSHDRKP